MVEEGIVEAEPPVYVSPLGSHAYPFDSWATAATNIQDAVDASMAGGLVLVTNGVFQSSSPINVGKWVTLRSVNGADATVIQAGVSNRCLTLSNSTAVVGGLHGTWGQGQPWWRGVLRGRDARGGLRGDEQCGRTYVGGGVYCAVGVLDSCLVSGCVVVSNAATGKAGGVDCAGTLLPNCTVSANKLTLSGFDTGGGGIYCQSGCIADCLVQDNTILEGGPSWRMLSRRVAAGSTATGDGWSGATCGGMPRVAPAAGGGHGGGIAARGGEVINCLISGNSVYAGHEWGGSAVLVVAGCW